MSTSFGKNDFVFVIFNYFNVVVGSWCAALLLAIILPKPFFNAKIGNC